jgi:hypothetical protein
MSLSERDLDNIRDIGNDNYIKVIERRSKLAID